MLQPSTIPFQFKLMAGAIATVAVAIGLLTFINLRQVNRSLQELGETSLRSYADTVHAMMEMQDTQLRSKAAADLNLLSKEVGRAGIPSLNPLESTRLEVVNAVTGARETLELPMLMLSAKVVTPDFALVDGPADGRDGTASIFQLAQGRLVRVASSATASDGSRAVGDFLPREHAASAAVAAGKGTCASEHRRASAQRPVAAG